MNTQSEEREGSFCLPSWLPTKVFVCFPGNRNACWCICRTVDPDAILAGVVRSRADWSSALGCMSCNVASFLTCGGLGGLVLLEIRGVNAAEIITSVQTKRVGGKPGRRAGLVEFLFALES